MAFDYGSLDLGLKNPFKKEGVVTAIRGGIQVAIGIILLFQAVAQVNEDQTVGWILIIFGISVLAFGIRVLSGGILATLRYFVGRNPPTSLSLNYSKSESSSAQEESTYVQYNKDELEEMLVGRKNITFVEPDGFLARLLHSVLPKLLYMPYPIRNMAQRIFGAWINTITSLIAYAFIALVTLAGFTGEAGKLTFPIYSTLLTVYIAIVWFSAGRAIFRDAEKTIQTLGGTTLAKIISFSIIMPVAIGLGLSTLMSSTNITAAEVESFFDALPSLNPVLYLIGILVAAALSSFAIITMLKYRIQFADPRTEVSELRENWQESIHPNEIFINLDNLVMANRRYKEVPNRVYRELDPKLNAQVEGKGSFDGIMIQEIQPKVFEMNLGEAFSKTRVVSLLSANILYVVGIAFTYLLAHSIPSVYSYAKDLDFGNLTTTSAEFSNLVNLSMTAAHYLLIGFIINSFARVMANSAHLFYAEMQFESLIVYFKCEGTFTESKISTGTGIHDSTRSENTLVRSSITPWIIVSRLVSATFAATGMKNLEHPRYILEMHKSDSNLALIKEDVLNFLKDRESIASITSVRDLDNASKIHQINERTRAMPSSQQIEHDEQAAGFLKKENESDNDETETEK